MHPRSFRLPLALTLAFVLAAAPLTGAQTTQPAPKTDGVRERTYVGATTAPATTQAAELKAPSTVDQIKNPVAWFKWGADLRLREKYLNNVIMLSDTASAEKDKERHFQRIRTRIWSTLLDPRDVVEGNIRMTWETRFWEQPEPSANFPNFWYSGPIVFDNLNVKLNFQNIGDLGLPLTVQVGRQDMLNPNGSPLFGDGWLVLDGTPLDGSRTIYFDAARAAWDCAPIKTKFDLVYIDQGGHDEHWLPTINRFQEDQIEQDERGLIAYVTNKSITATQLDGYFIYKHDKPTSTPAGHYFNAGNFFRSYADSGEVYTLGGRIAHSFDAHWSARIEGAGQFGHKSGVSLHAFGENGRLTYAFKDSMNDQLRLGYEFMSGDNPTTGARTHFDPLWGRWPQFSELYVYSYAAETRIGEVTNLHRLNLGWTIEPTKKMQFLLDYDALFADTNFAPALPAPVGQLVDGNGYFRGHLVTAVLKYKFNRFMTGHLWGEFFFPGDFYAPAHRDAATFLRAELMFTF